MRQAACALNSDFCRHRPPPTLKISHHDAYILSMKRREFLTTATAAAAIPALPAIAVPAATAAPVPNAARYWAIYMTNLHGDVSPGMLAKATGLSTAKAAAIRTDLIAANVLKPTRIIASTTATKTVTQKNLMKSARKAFDALLDQEQDVPAPTDPANDASTDAPAKL